MPSAEIDTALLVYCPDRVVSRRYHTMFEANGLCLSLRPLIFTPDDVPLVVDQDIATTNPALAVFSAICHGDLAEAETAFPALMAALRSLSPEQAALHYDVVLAGLPMATRTRWEEFMKTVTRYEYQSEFMRNLQATALAHAILVALEKRGMAAPDDFRDRVTACTDNGQLETWLGRAVNATTIDDVIGE
ncbi:hypothetical protein [Paractinoplanes globisporus]|uniref:Uncharacterized protein n=1 Tax=Paractinoplanes globisporus TaxID=113565 RepID=A0ABW6WMH7_9ACTN|nr:hypothetical protein [Actinoplanes globisporus]